MKLKQIVAATVIAAASMSALAVPLGSVNGTADWKMNGYSTGAYTGGAYGNENTFAFGRITSIDADAGPAASWTSGFSDGTYLSYVLYGVGDISFSPFGPAFNIYSAGATGGAADGEIHLDVYRSNVDVNLGGITLASRTGFGSLAGLTDVGSLYLSTVLVTGGILDDPFTAVDEAANATLSQTVTALTLPASGGGFFYSRVTGGSAAYQWNTNGFLGGTADFNANFSLANNRNCTTTTADGNTCSTATPDGDDFPGKINDPVGSNSVPEPGSMALLGLSLAGLGFLRRRKTA